MSANLLRLKRLPDEDDEEAWNEKYEEEQRAKKAKIEAAKKLAIPSFVPSASSSRSNSPFAWGSQPHKSIEFDAPAQPVTGNSKEGAISLESGDDDEHSGGSSGNSGDDEEQHEEVHTEDDMREDQAGADDASDQEADEVGEPIPELDPKESLFSRISGKLPSPEKKKVEPILQPSADKSFKPGFVFGSTGKTTPEAPAFSPFTPVTKPKGDFVPTTTFNFTPTPASVGPVFGSGLKVGPIPGEGLFGSRPSTPQPGQLSSTDSKQSNIFGAGVSFGASDNTYAKGSPIKFGTSTSSEARDKETSAPAVEVTAATPPAREQTKPFAGLFGQSSFTPSANGGTSLGFNFGTPSSSSAPAPGFLSAASHLAGGSTNASSRASSPGITSEAESVATDNTEDYSNEPQTSLINSNAGEEDEAEARRL